MIVFLLLGIGQPWKISLLQTNYHRTLFYKMIIRGAVVREWKETTGIRSLQWPACSPNLNPIEHAWHYLGRKIVQTPANLATLRNLLVQEWNAIPQAYINSMTNRVGAVIRAEGGSTRY